MALLLLSYKVRMNNIIISSISRNILNLRSAKLYFVCWELNYLPHLSIQTEHAASVHKNLHV